MQFDVNPERGATGRVPVVKITELQGDGIGPELAQAVRQVAEALPIAIEFIPIDWSLNHRVRTGLEAIDAAEASMRETRLGMKYPTVTGPISPNSEIRRRLKFSVIHRPVISIKGIDSHFKEDVNLHIVRVATGGTYEDPGRYIGTDTAVSLRIVERTPCEQAAHFAFRLAREKGQRMQGAPYSVTSSSKHTIQKATDGLFESVVSKVSDNYSDVTLQTELFDALLGRLILTPEQYRVVLVLNEYGDFLSDMASGLVGSLGTGASGNYAFDEDMNIAQAMFDPAAGTAPDIAGKNICNPTAVFLSFGMLLDHIDRYDLGHALRLSVLKCIEQGVCTRDLGGSLSTTEFTKAVTERLPEYLSFTEQKN